MKKMGNGEEVEWISHEYASLVGCEDLNEGWGNVNLGALHNCLDSHAVCELAVDSFLIFSGWLIEWCFWMIGFLVG